MEEEVGMWSQRREAEGSEYSRQPLPVTRSLSLGRDSWGLGANSSPAREVWGGFMAYESSTLMV